MKNCSWAQADRIRAGSSCTLFDSAAPDANTCSGLRQPCRSHACNMDISRVYPRWPRPRRCIDRGADRHKWCLYCRRRPDPSNFCTLGSYREHTCEGTDICRPAGIFTQASICKLSVSVSTLRAIHGSILPSWPESHLGYASLTCSTATAGSFFFPTKNIYVILRFPQYF